VLCSALKAFRLRVITLPFSYIVFRKHTIVNVDTCAKTFSLSWIGSFEYVSNLKLEGQSGYCRHSKWLRSKVGKLVTILLKSPLDGVQIFRRAVV
jgi:hypothetical protein